MADQTQTTTYDPKPKPTAAPNGAAPAQQSAAATALATTTPEHGEIVRLSMDTVQGFAALQRAAKLLCASSLVPQRFQGPENLPNAVIALEMANRIGAAPLMVMQHLYVVHGTPAWSAQFLIATLNASKKFSALRYEANGQQGDKFGLRAWAKELATGDVVRGPFVTWEMVKGEGWLAKSGSKWKTMPDLMFMYRAATFFVRTHAPEIAMGIRTVDEVEDIIDITPDRFPSPAGSPGVETSAPAIVDVPADAGAPADANATTPAPEPSAAAETVKVPPPSPDPAPAQAGVKPAAAEPPKKGTAGLRERLAKPTPASGPDSEPSPFDE